MKKKRKKARAGLILAVILLVLLLGAGAALYFVRTEQVTVKGNRYISSGKVKSLYFEEEEDLRLYRVLMKMYLKKPVSDAYRSISAKFTGLQSVEITVSEQEPCAQILTNGQAVLFSENGVCLGLHDADGELPSITGISLLPCYEGEKAETKDGTHWFQSALAYCALLPDSGLPYKEIRYQDGSLYLMEKDVWVSLGDASSAREKLKEVRAQYPVYEGLYGIMHLESFDPEKEDSRFYFEVPSASGN